MSRTYHHGERSRRLRIRKNPPDLRRVARSFIALAQVEAEAQSEARRHGPKTARTNPPTSVPKDPEPSRSHHSGDAA
jgi:hypothetical protein